MALSDISQTGIITASEAGATSSVAGAAITLATGGFDRNTWIARLSGTFSAGSTLHFAGSYDGGATFDIITANQTVGGSATGASQTVGGTVPQVWEGNNAVGLTHIRLWCSALASGDAIGVLLIASEGGGGSGTSSSSSGGPTVIEGDVYAPNALPNLSGPGQRISIDPSGTIYTHGRPLTLQDLITAVISDGVHTGTIKPANTAPQGTDTPLVVAVSPVTAGPQPKTNSTSVAIASDQIVPVANTASNLTAALSFTSPASASTVAQTPVTGLGAYRSCYVYAALTGATGGTLDIYIQVSPDGGTTWVDYAHFTQIAAGAATIFRSFTLTRYAQNTTLTTVGTGTSPALAAGTIIGGDWGDRMRVVAVAGASTTAGAAQTILLVLSS